MKSERCKTIEISRTTKSRGKDIPARMFSSLLDDRRLRLDPPSIEEEGASPLTRAVAALLPNQCNDAVPAQVDQYFRSSNCRDFLIMYSSK